MGGRSSDSFVGGVSSWFVGAAAAGEVLESESHPVSAHVAESVNARVIADVIRGFMVFLCRIMKKSPFSILSRS